MMNERIQNLAEQAGAVKYEADWKRDSYPVNLAELEKFAELIVQECIDSLPLDMDTRAYTRTLRALKNIMQVK